MPFVYEHPVYWQKIEEETKGSGDIERSTCLFIDSEKAREHAEEEMIKVENIKGRLFLVGAEDDSFWEAGKYIRRMDRRLKERPHTCEYVPLVYEHGTHFVLPESCSAWHCLWDLSLCCGLFSRRQRNTRMNVRQQGKILTGDFRLH